VIPDIVTLEPLGIVWEVVVQSVVGRPVVGDRRELSTHAIWFIVIVPPLPWPRVMLSTPAVLKVWIWQLNGAGSMHITGFNLPGFKIPKL
jgi:hypothetical protein